MLAVCVCIFWKNAEENIIILEKYVAPETFNYPVDFPGFPEHFRCQKWVEH